MSFSEILGITQAYAAEAVTTATTAPATTGAAHPQGSFLSMLPMLVIFVVVFYFLLVRPQQKRAKDQRKLVESITIGDEVVTAGGIVGRISKLRDNYIVLNVAKEQEITMQKNAVVSVLPKGTLETITG